jgi:hypothetical protein
MWQNGKQGIFLVTDGTQTQINFVVSEVSMEVIVQTVIVWFINTISSYVTEINILSLKYAIFSHNFISFQQQRKKVSLKRPVSQLVNPVLWIKLYFFPYPLPRV